MVCREEMAADAAAEKAVGRCIFRFSRHEYRISLLLHLAPNEKPAEPIL